MKEGPGERYCSFCHANLTLGEEHDADCENVHEDPYALDEPDPYAEYESDDSED